jgi:hypothetical protein
VVSKAVVSKLASTETSVSKAAVSKLVSMETVISEHHSYSEGYAVTIRRGALANYASEVSNGLSTFQSKPVTLAT